MLHIVLSKSLDFAAMDAEAAAGKAPRHVVRDLARLTDAQFHMPDVGRMCAASDALRAKLFGTPAHWALARSVVECAAPDDVIFATGEDVGIALAACAGARHPSNRPHLAVFAHNMTRPRARAALRIFRCARANATWLTNSSHQRQFLETTLDVPPARVHMIPEQTDTVFFTPGAVTTGIAADPPLIVSVGVERRDYRTLAAAAGALAVRVELSAFSKDAHVTRAAMPETLPEKFSVQRYSWNDLRALYRRAAVVVVPLFANPFCAGFTAMLEAMACGTPVIVTRTAGLEEHLAQAAHVGGHHVEIDGRFITLTVPPGNPHALRAAIQWTFDHPAAAREMAARALAWVRDEHCPERWFAAMENALAITSSKNSPAVSALRS